MTTNNIRIKQRQNRALESIERRLESGIRSGKKNEANRPYSEKELNVLNSERQNLLLKLKG